MKYDLFIHQKRVETVFELLGDKEDDLSYALGWTLVHAPRFFKAIVKRISQQDLAAEAHVS
jgi:hypothetical protein